MLPFISKSFLASFFNPFSILPPTTKGGIQQPPAALLSLYSNRARAAAPTTGRLHIREPVRLRRCRCLGAASTKPAKLSVPFSFNQIKKDKPFFFARPQESWHPSRSTSSDDCAVTTTTTHRDFLNKANNKVCTCTTTV